MLAAERAMLRERELLLVRLLVLACVIAHAATGTALEFYKIFREFGLCHKELMMFPYDTGNRTAAQPSRKSLTHPTSYAIIAPSSPQQLRPFPL